MRARPSACTHSGASAPKASSLEVVSLSSRTRCRPWGMPSSVAGQKPRNSSFNASSLLRPACWRAQGKAYCAPYLTPQVVLVFHLMGYICMCAACLLSQLTCCCSVADKCTAAISEDGALYTWGDGAAGNLGYGDAVRQSIPRHVESGLRDHSIVQVHPSTAP